MVPIIEIKGNHKNYSILIIFFLNGKSTLEDALKEIVQKNFLQIHELWKIKREWKSATINVENIGGNIGNT